jgi:protein-S-isoprenylcysteine O-methyltransferase Ste14
VSASDFEFRYRFWIICALFGIAFSTYSIDAQNTGATLVQWIARLRGTTATDADYHAIFALAALFCIAAALVLGMLLFDYRLILREEAGLAIDQGDSFRAYRAAVPRLLPALRPQLASGGRVPNWPDGFLGEAFIWVMAASVATFAITLNMNVFFVVLASSFVVYGICLAIIKRQHN